ncbi:MAG: hypothetical protein JSV42_18560 [Chloroflexota bacterium]|nr:MAG: hypothetical protein JSV42_18560 [Chloroflexota bacterium]
MNQEHYEFIYQIHQQQLNVNLIQEQLRKGSQENPGLRKRTLLYLSDIMLNLGQRIRPVEFRVVNRPGQAQDHNFEINAGGC